MSQWAFAVTSLLNSWIASALGPQANHIVFATVTWADMSVTLSVLLLTLVVNVLVAAIVWRRSKVPSPSAEGSALRPHVFRALGKPVYILIWTFGLYLAAMPLVSTVRSNHAVAVIETAGGVLFDIIMFGAVTWCFFRFTRVLDTGMTLWASRTSSKLDALLVPTIGRSLRILVPVLGIIFALPLLHFPPRYDATVAKGTSILLIIVVALILLQTVHVGERVLLTRFDTATADNLRARKVQTQVHVMSRVLDVIIGLFAVACVLMLFSQVRHVGASLLASAGIVGIVAGIAAQKTLANLLAGFQIALAQPMREDDVVIVEGEWGRVEEITLTYVVVHIWDDTRLVVPLSYFIETPFQNWTRTSAGLLGQVHIWVDYSFPVAEGRKALKQIIETNPLWDKRFWNLQVVEASEKSMQLRVLATAADSSIAWNLRCEIREQFIAYIQRSHPESLPMLRAELKGTTSGPVAK
ncbi:MAG: mechanosensitive ion channel family protein [Steroidobacteraceae bacterium]